MPPAPIVFLYGVDNTLLDNDRVTADLRAYLAREVGPEGSRLYWELFEALRSELGYADYLGALQRYRREQQHEPHLLAVSRFLLDYPFAERLFPGALEVVARVKQWGPAVILSDGDVVFQPRKVDRSGLAAAVDGNVLLYIHKERELDDVQLRFPAERYVMIDDKLRILTAIKSIWGERVTTVFVRQGHYALDSASVASYPPADRSVDHIAELLQYGLGRFSGGLEPQRGRA